MRTRQLSLQAGNEDLASGSLGRTARGPAAFDDISARTRVTGDRVLGI